MTAECNHTGSEALTATSSLRESEHSSSTIEQVDYPELDWNDIKVGKLLGKGAFSKVKEATFRDKRFGKRKYAIKFLRNTTVSSELFTDAAVDLAVEGRLLTQLKHENIIQLVGQGCLTNPYENGDRRHFLVLERLDDETLEQVLQEWRWTDLKVLMEHYGRMTIPSQVERVQSIALPIARALEYLHSNQICFRDVKPQNVGFRDGTVKLFDFGLARRVVEDRKLTDQVGSPLYMAPETMLALDYGLPSDVYSFSVMLWELLTLDQPFENVIDKSDLEKMVARNHIRPILDERVGPIQLQELLSSGWDRRPEARPTFATIVKVLEDHVQQEIDVLGKDMYHLSLESDRQADESHTAGARAA